MDNNQQAMNLSKAKVPSYKWWLLAILIFLCLNLRSPLTTIDPLLGMIERQLHVTEEQAGLFALLPIGVLGIASVLTPHIARYVPIWKIVLWCLLVSMAGMYWRSYGGLTGMICGTIITGIGIGIIGSSIPGFVKANFPNHAPKLIGAYSGLLGTSTAIASVFALPMAHATNSWRFSLFFWAIPLAVVGALWLTYFLMHKDNEVDTPLKTNIWKMVCQWTAQWMTLFYLLRVCVTYFCITWMTILLKSRGMEVDLAGVIFSVIGVSQIPSSFFSHWLASRLGGMSRLIYVSVLISVVSIWGIMYLPLDYVLPLSIMLGLGIGAIAACGMALMVIKTKDQVAALEISSMMQGVGFLGGSALALFLSKFVDQTGNYWIYCLIILILNIFIAYVGHRCDVADSVD